MKRKVLLSILVLLTKSQLGTCSESASKRPGTGRHFEMPSLGNVNLYRFYNKNSNSTNPRGGGSKNARIRNPLDADGKQTQQGNQDQSDDAVVAHHKKLIEEMDRNLLKLLIPMMATFAINPLVAALDLFWVNRLGNALAVAGQAAANQVYSSTFWLFSFLPSVTATLVSKRHASGDTEGTQEAICQALVLSFFIALSGTMFMFFKPERALSSILKAGAPALSVAKPYLKIRSFSFFPMMISFVGFSAFRGMMDIQTAVKIALCANAFTVALDPLLIHVLGFGVTGAAMATLAAEIIAASAYLSLLLKRNLITWSKLWKIPSLSSLAPVLKGGMALQVRSVALNITFLLVARVIQSIDENGIAAAAHALTMQTTQLGGIVLGALSMVAQTIVPNAMVERYDDNNRQIGGAAYAKATVKRLMRWGVIFGVGAGCLQLLLLPGIMRSSPLPEVRAAAKVPAMISSCFQLLNGLVMIGEGIMIGTGSFVHLSINVIIATLAFVASLQVLPNKFGLTGVWIGLGIFTSLRLVGVVVHQVYGPLTRRTKLNKETS